MDKDIVQFKELNEVVKAIKEEYMQAIKENKQFAEVKSIYLRLPELTYMGDVLSQKFLS